MSKKLIKKRILKKLVGLYSSLPSIECKGLCVESCGSIAMTEIELKRMIDKSGTTPTIDDHGTCSLLVDGKCSVYEVRPAICRMFGVAQGMECPFGCLPNPKYLNPEEGRRFLFQIDDATDNKPKRSTLPELAKILNTNPLK